MCSVFMKICFDQNTVICITFFLSQVREYLKRLCQISTTVLDNGEFPLQILFQNVL